MIVVIGSGPAATAATSALVERGERVTMLDIGRRLEPENQAAVARMASVPPSGWNIDDLDLVSGSSENTDDELHPKRLHGSRFCFAGEDSPNRIVWNGRAGFRHSDAEGGLSNIWGAALLPSRQQDMKEWPISIADLEPHYRAVMEFLPSTAVEDGLENILPSYTRRATPLAPSQQGSALLRDLARAKDKLRSAGIHFGRSRLAIEASGNAGSQPCAYCGLCLSGCPYSLIYETSRTLAPLIASGKLIYRRGHLVQKIENQGDGVAIVGKDLENNTPFRIHASRVFLATGVLPSAKIILSSLGRHGTPIELKDSQYFILPMLRFRGTADVESERMHTSAQVFMEMDAPAVSENLVHMQAYGYSQMLVRELDRTFMRPMMKPAAIRKALLGRLMVIQGFLHSNDSGHTRLVLKNDGGEERLIATTTTFPHARKTAMRAAWKLVRQAKALGAIPLIPFMRVPPAGAGYHSGGSFPMRPNPGELETDPLGRLPSMPRVYLVDSSVFPSIPATSITLSVMANAHRIATESTKLAQS